MPTQLMPLLAFPAIFGEIVSIFVLMLRENLKISKFLSCFLRITLVLRVFHVLKEDRARDHEDLLPMELTLELCAAYGGI